MNNFASLLRVSGLQGFSGGLFGPWRTLFTRPQLPIFSKSLPPTPMFGIGGAASPSGSGLLAPSEGLLGGVSGRTNVRNHFPRARETKRIKAHGWRTRMSTKAGRRILMNRILKGRHVISH